MLNERKSLLNRALSRLDPDNFPKILAQLEKKVLAGDLTLEDFDNRQVEIETYTAQYEQKNKLISGLKARDVVLSFGPKKTAWENGVWAAKNSLILVFLLFIIFLPGLLDSMHSVQYYYPLRLSSQIVMFFADWLLAAFFFGYLFPYPSLVTLMRGI